MTKTLTPKQEDFLEALLIKTFIFPKAMSFFCLNDLSIFTAIKIYGFLPPSYLLPFENPSKSNSTLSEANAGEIHLL